MGPETLGRIINVIGEPVDECGPIGASRAERVERWEVDAGARNWQAPQSYPHRALQPILILVLQTQSTTLPSTARRRPLWSRARSRRSWPPASRCGALALPPAHRMPLASCSFTLLLC